MRALIVGGGGREHALAWALRRDDPTLELLAAPGNPGIAELARCVPIPATDVDALASLAARERIELTVVGPEAPLAAGIVDRFRSAGLPIFGPTAAAARIESSKSFAKSIMRKAGVPTARASAHRDLRSAREAIRRAGAPVVVKATGLAAGKGVLVCRSTAEAEYAASMLLEARAMGSAGLEILVEEFMEGEELSIFAITDGTVMLPMLPAQDHKRLGAGDEGPNTGGMGAYAPVSVATDELVVDVIDRVFAPTLRALREHGCPFAGLLYAGLMLTSEGTKVVEFNCRFGDPETEAILPLLDSSLLEPVLRVALGESLVGAPVLRWRAGAAVTTVIAAPGYPEVAQTGTRMSIPDPQPNVLVFHAGTATDAGNLVSAGGRVLAVTGLAPTVAEAQRRSADFAQRVELEGKQMRSDIGWREIERVAGAA